MPVPGEQHLQSAARAASNPFEEVKPRISEYTAQEIATLQSRLEKQLGPEYISARKGPSGAPVHYIAAEKCIQLANEVFGFNGWSSQIMDVQVDFVDENPTTLKVSLGLSVIVRVTLRDGTFHEDVGYGHMENAKGKAAAFEKAKKEGTTDALKRALRNFGNVLGNCIYDKQYLAKVTKIKVPPTKWDVDNLHRHSTVAPPVKKEEVRGVDEKAVVPHAGKSLTAEDTFEEDEFGDFDEADFSVDDPDSHPDEVALPAPAVVPSHQNKPSSNNNNGPPQNQNRTFNRQQQSAAAPRPQNQPPQAANPSAYPQTPQSGFSRSHSGSDRQMPPPQNPGPQTRAMPSGPAGPPPVIQGRTLNQPSRLGPLSAPASPAPSDKDDNNIESFGLPPAGTGFVSARGAATVLPSDHQAADVSAAPPRIPNHLPAFDPHAESPSIRKTPGVDHRVSKPLARDGKHVAAAFQPAAAGAGPRPGVLDAHRRIGAPNSPSPMANKNSYKPPTMMKRPVDQRTPLLDLPANGTLGGGDGGDVKRQRLNG